MKILYTYIYTLLLSLAALPAMAQTVPFVEEGKTWKMEYIQGPFFDPSSTLEMLTLEGDTVIAGRTWKKMYYSGNGVRQLATALYEEDGKVYYLPHVGATEGKLLYDFKMEIDEESTFYCPYSTVRLQDEEDPNGYYNRGASIKIRDTGKVEYDDNLYNCFYVSLDGHYYTDPFIEGIGNIYNPLKFTDIIKIGGPYYHLIECRTSSGTLYSDKRYESARFAEEGKTWIVERRKRYDLENNTGAPSTFEKYVIEGDTTLLKSSTWMKLYRVDEATGKKTFVTALTEDPDRSPNNRIFYLPYEGATYRALLYDFGAPVHDFCTFYELGETDRLPAKDEYVETSVECDVQDIYTVESNGYHLDKFEAIGNQNSYSYKYLEAVGNLVHPFKFIKYTSPDCDETSHVVECSVGGKVIYSEPVWKDPTTGIEIVRDNESMAKENALYDLSGRRIYQTPKHGVYIRNGRKFIVK